jgi:hypothetical protein
MDALREQAGAPDVTTVEVSSDGYELTFRVAVPTNPVVTPDMRIRIWLDADEDVSTGLKVEGLVGLDHFVLVDPTRFPPDEAVLYSCTGATCGPSSRSPGFTYSSGAIFTVDAMSLGLRRVGRLRFSVTVTTGILYDPATGYDFDKSHVDVAPDEGMWTYDALPLHVDEFRMMPPRPRAGEQFRMTMRVLDTATGAPLRRGNVTCSLVIAGARAQARFRRLTAPHAECVFQVPTDTRGRRFRATIGITAGETVVRRSLSGRIDQRPFG